MSLARLAALMAAGLSALAVAVPSDAGPRGRTVPEAASALVGVGEASSLGAAGGVVPGMAGVPAHLARTRELLQRLPSTPLRARAALLNAAFDAAGEAETPLLDAIDKLGDRTPAAVRKAAHEVAAIQGGIAKAQFAQRLATGKLTFPVTGRATPLQGPFGQWSLPDGSAIRAPRRPAGPETGLAYPVAAPGKTGRESEGAAVPPSIDTPAGSIATDPGVPTADTVTDIASKPVPYICETDASVCSAKPANTFLAGQALILNAEVAVGTYLAGTSRRYTSCVMAVGVDSPNSSVGDTRTVLFSGATDCVTNNIATYGQSGAYEWLTYSGCPQAGDNCVKGAAKGWTCFCGGIVDTGANYFYRNAETQLVATESWLSMAINDFAPNGTDNRWTYSPPGCDPAGNPIINCAIFSLVPFGFIPDFDKDRTPAWALGIVNGVLAQVQQQADPLVAQILAAANNGRDEALCAAGANPSGHTPGAVCNTTYSGVTPDPNGPTYSIAGLLAYAKTLPDDATVAESPYDSPTDAAFVVAPDTSKGVGANRYMQMLRTAVGDASRDRYLHFCWGHQFKASGQCPGPLQTWNYVETDSDSLGTVCVKLYYPKSKAVASRACGTSYAITRWDDHPTNHPLPASCGDQGRYGGYNGYCYVIPYAQNALDAPVTLYPGGKY